MATAEQRREQILRIIREESVSSQQSILERLAELGHRVTQPTLSRDLREMGVAKTPEGYVLPGEVGSGFAPLEAREERFAHLIRERVVEAVVSGTLVVLRTSPAEAGPVARAIDEAEIEGVAGTIGGEDTVFVATASEAAAEAFAKRVGSILARAARSRETR